MRHERLARVTAAYAASHLVVDLACITTVMGLVAPALAGSSPYAHYLAVVAYDMIAFCMQLPLGAALDAAGPARWRPAAMASFALVAVGVLASRVPGVPATCASVLSVALGNALFHCAGGEEVLLGSDGRAAPSGAFISTGAVGVFVGGLVSFHGWSPVVPMLVALLVACAAAVWSLGPSGGEAALAWSLDARGWAAVALLAATVALRSYAGTAMSYPWKAEAGLAVAAVAMVVAGKAAGGLVSDRFGPLAAALVSLGGSAPLFLASWDVVGAGLLATLLFNLTMAITLSELARLLPRARGMAFGIASFSLALGALPALLGLRVGGPGVLCALSLASLCLLVAGLGASGRA